MIFKSSMFEIPIYKMKAKNHNKIQDYFLTNIIPKIENIPPNNHDLNLYSDYFDGLDKLDNEFKELYKFDVEAFKLKAGFNKNAQWTTDTDMWYNIGVSGSWQEEHDHQGGLPSVSYSAIHYVKYNPNEHMPTIFYNPIHKLYLKSMQPCINTELPDDFSTGSFSPNISEGDIIFFPSYVSHMVRRQTSSEFRITVAINLTITEAGIVNRKN
jgi:hypothetical protein